MGSENSLGFGHWKLVIQPEERAVHRYTWLLLLAFSLLLMASAHATDQCVTCHTDPAKLQALIKPPTAIVQEEGEG
jgi:hypothetical protein